MESGSLSVSLHESTAFTDAAAWDALCPDDNPFVSHAFLSTLERTGCIRADYGWQPAHLALKENDVLVGVAPCYVKHNSHGEFVFDHAWAHAYAQHGVDYFPKLLCASPYSPVTGPRLLAKTPMHQGALARALSSMAARLDLSSAHVNFHSPEESPVFEADWFQREDVQYIWRNRSGWQTFDDYLAAMDSKHRKNIRQERRKLHDAGIRFSWIQGGDATEVDCRCMFDLYLGTFAMYGNHPALTLEFFHEIVRALPTQTAFCFASDTRRNVIAGAFYFESSSTLFGRYWGSTQDLPGLHFETCYYQGIEHCLRTGRDTFEPGAGGVHKISRGFLPEVTRSHHWIRDDAFRAAIRDWCAQERAGTPAYMASLMQRSPFRA